MRIIIFANGEMPHARLDARLVQEQDFIICADGGARHALALGLTPDVVVGDMDSLDESIIARLQAAGTSIHRFSPDKDFTDLELALQMARDMQPQEVILLGALGGRLDQMLANLMLLASPSYADMPIVMVSGMESARAVRDEIVIRGRVRDIVSVIPLSDDVSGLTYHGGLRWLLHDATLPLGSSRGVSNELTDDTARISLRSGVILVIHTRR